MVMTHGSQRRILMIKFKSEYFDTNKNTVHVNDTGVQEMIDKVLEDLIASKEKADFHFRATGDTLVAGVKWDAEGEIEIIVTQRYNYACLLKDKYGNYQPIDWLEEKENEYADMSKEEVIDRIRYLERQKAEYNPSSEV